MGELAEDNVRGIRIDRQTDSPKDIHTYICILHTYIIHVYIYIYSV